MGRIERRQRGLRGPVAQFVLSEHQRAGRLDQLTREAAAVQAAIWFFSDRYVLNTSDPLHDAVVAIVDFVRQRRGRSSSPPPPTLTITPTTLSAPAGSVIGPFTVTSTVSPITVTATGATMYSDANATMPITGGTVASGAQIWLKSTGPTAAVLEATAQATVPSGNVYVYDGNSSPNAAQKLILAETATLKTTVRAAASFQAPGSLVVNKTIAGPAAGQQGPITIHTVCATVALTPDFTILAGTAAGTQTHTYNNIPAGATCKVTETVNGGTSTVSVKVVGGGPQGDGADRCQRHGGFDRYLHPSSPGSSSSTRRSPGPPPASRARSPSTPSAAPPPSPPTSPSRPTPPPAPCPRLIPTSPPVPSAPSPKRPTAATSAVSVTNGVALTPDLTVIAGAAAGNQSQTYSNIPAGSNCIVVELVDGHTTTVNVTVTGPLQPVTIRPRPPRP